MIEWPRTTSNEGETAMTKTCERMSTQPPEDDVPPARFVVDDMTFARIKARLENPRQPTRALCALFKK